MAYEWPGNVRELENAVEHAVVLGQDLLILSDDLPDAVAEAASSATATDASLHFHTTIQRAKKDLIVRAVQEAGGNYSAAARLLGLHPNYLHRLSRSLQLKPVRENAGER
jgi:DNA-binding NtrC family response regulator